MIRQLFSPQILQQIKAQCDLPSVVGRYIKLNRHLKAICPFHQEKTESFKIFLKKQNWFCFGCRRGGDIFDFIQEIENLSFANAVEFLAKEAKISIALPKSERFKSYKFRRAITRKERLVVIDELEKAFVEYERVLADILLLERKGLPYEKKTWDWQDYLEEQYLDYRFEQFNNLQQEREEEFARLRREA